MSLYIVLLNSKRLKKFVCKLYCMYNHIYSLCMRPSEQSLSACFAILSVTSYKTKSVGSIAMGQATDKNIGLLKELSNSWATLKAYLN